MSVHNVLKSLQWISNKASVINLQDILNSRIRLFATESKAVEKIKIRNLRRSTKQTDFGSYFLLLIPVSAFGLGTWQVFRKFEKDEEIKKFMEVIKQPPVALPENLDELKQMEFRAVKVRGRFDHSKEIYMGPRPKIDKDSASKFASLLSSNKGGYLVITPFTLSDRNLTILVNRGWVHPKEKLPKNRPNGQITEEVEIVGLVRNHEVRRPLEGKNSPEHGIWIYRDLEKMSEVTGAAPVLIDADLASTVPGGPLGGQSVVEVPNHHVSYLFTWYSLSAVSFYMWCLRNMQKISIIV